MSAQSLTFYTLDVFTTQQFGGNPLAVFVDAEGLSDQQMANIAKEMNLSETVFVGCKTGVNRWPVRIFTPASEIPFAGHPTVGTACLLKELGWIDGAAKTAGGQEQSTQGALILDEKVGPVPVTFESNSVEPGAYQARFTCAVPPYMSEGKINQKEAASLLSLEEHLIADMPYVADCGVPYLMVPVVNGEAVKLASFNQAVWSNLLKGSDQSEVCIYGHCSEDYDLKMRMFAPGAGIAEDPATGSAAAALIGGLALREERLTGERRAHNYRIFQGLELGRPSYIGTFAEPMESGDYRVEVFGQAVLVSKGSFYLNA